MHDLVNDLAQLVSGEFSTSLEDGKIYRVLEKTRHLSYLITKYDVYKRFDPLSQVSPNIFTKKQISVLFTSLLK